MLLHTDGSRLRDEHGRHRIFHGINLVAKGHQQPRDTAPVDHVTGGFVGAWTETDIRDLAERGFSIVRLGLIWAAIEPAPGVYDEDYIDWLRGQLDLLHGHGLAVLLDAHQDLFSQSFSDGAPTWATLTTAEYSSTDLWSDAYLLSPAVHESLDNFWANAAGPAGPADAADTPRGLQDRFASMWARVVTRLGDHPAVLGYDLLNEPAPGSPSPAIFGSVLGAFAAATGQEFDTVMADFAEPEAMFAQLAHLDNVEIHHEVGDALAPMIGAFETDVVHPFMARVAAAVRGAEAAADHPRRIIAREHSYFANIGIPSGQPPLDDPAWVYSPHGYDLTVDTAAIALSSDTRAGTIFARHRQTQDRLDVPVIVGEWGALDEGPGTGPHARFLVDLFDSYGWSWTYWCWTPGFAGSEAAAELTRPRPRAFAGDGLGWAVTPTGFTAAWAGRDCTAPSEFFIPGGQVAATRDGAEVPVERDGHIVRVPAGAGDFHLTATGPW